MAKKDNKIEIEPENTNFTSIDLIPPPPPKRKVVNMKKSTLFLIASVTTSLICGIVAIAMYIQYLGRFEGVPLEFTNFDPNLWVIIPIAFGIGFLIPVVAWVLFHIP